jgi:hypothetical protein
MTTMSFFTAAPVTDSEVGAIIALESGGYWLLEKNRGGIDTEDSTVYVDLATDISSEYLGLEADLEQKIKQRLGQPWKTVILTHISHVHVGSTERAIRFLNVMKSTWGGVIFDEIVD